MIRHTLAALFVVCPTLALADSQLERLEVLSEQLNLEMAKMMAREISANGGDPAPMMAVLPDTTWDDAYRDAGRCMLDEYNAVAGTSGTDQMLDQMEAMIPELATQTIEGMSEMDILPAGMTEEQSGQIAQSCGMIELSMARMRESGFTAAMMEAFASTQSN